MAEVDALYLSTAEAIEQGTFDDASRSDLVDSLRSLAEATDPPVGDVLADAAAGIESGGDPEEHLVAGVLEAIERELSAADLWLARCSGSACTAP